MKKVLAIVVCIFAISLTACEPTSKETSQDYLLPKELSDCKVFKLLNTSGGRLNVLRCPNSVTTTTEVQGKTTAETVVIDGVEYTKAN